MAFYISHTQLPELSHLSPRQRKIVWLNFIEERQNKLKKTSSAIIDLLIASVIIIGMLTGFSAGFCLGDDELLGPMIGGAIGTTTACLVIFVVGLFRLNLVWRIQLKDYMQSDAFSLLSISKRVASLTNTRITDF
jgi:hypothetical protein